MSSKTHLNAAQQHAQRGRFTQMLAECRSILETPNIQPASLLDAGVLLFNFGFLSQAQACFEKAQALSPKDLVPMINLANVARDMGKHAEARALYSKLLNQLPDHPIIRRNALTSQEYDPEVSDIDRCAHAKAWGQWAIARSGGFRPRPRLTPLDERPLRIGYVSADLCQHTVGLFIKDVLKAHDQTRVQVFAYSAGSVKDWVTDEIHAACTIRDVSTLDDAALATQIRTDNIDVLVDLSGHTAGSRLIAFAHRPAPVMVSWLGYFTTTGLPYMDAVLLDKWHAPPGTETKFVEPILRLPTGRFCYQPVPWAPAEVSAPAFERNGFITFGCFNNTAPSAASVVCVGWTYGWWRPRG